MDSDQVEENQFNKAWRHFDTVLREGRLHIKRGVQWFEAGIGNTTQSYLWSEKPSKGIVTAFVLLGVGYISQLLRSPVLSIEHSFNSGIWSLIVVGILFVAYRVYGTKPHDTVIRFRFSAIDSLYTVTNWAAAITVGFGVAHISMWYHTTTEYNLSSQAVDLLTVTNDLLGLGNAMIAEFISHMWMFLLVGAVAIDYVYYEIMYINRSIDNE